MAERSLGSRLKAKEEEAALLHDIVRIIGSTWELQKILDEVIRLVSELTRADGVFLYLHDGGEMVLRASKNPRPNAVGRIRLKAGEGITGWVASEKRPVAISRNAVEDPRFKFFQALPEDRYEAFLSVPVLFKDQATGVINVQHRRARRHSDREKGLLVTIGSLVGGALEHARLHEDSLKKTEVIRDLSETLETRKAVERAKGLLMQERGMSESDAHRWLQNESMTRRKTMREIAEAVLLARELAKKPETRL